MRLIVKLAVLAGLRPGEIFGLKRGRIDATSAAIEQPFYRGIIDTPKTQKSKRLAAVSSGLSRNEGNRLAEPQHPRIPQRIDPSRRIYLDGQTRRLPPDVRSRLNCRSFHLAKSQDGGAALHVRIRRNRTGLPRSEKEGRKRNASNP